MKRSLKILIVLLFVQATIKVSACTLLLASGKATNDERPLLLKIRDSSDKNVVMRVVKGNGFTYTAQYSVKSTYTSGPWGGYNEKGFAVMNSLSWNIQETPSGDLNDDVIKEALETCETIDDFEKLLDSLEKPTPVRANFGVIDAYGNAAFYEMGQFYYTKYDANDPIVAPDGIIIRTNFSLSGNLEKLEKRDGEDRYIAASQLVENLKVNDIFNWKNILQIFPRYLKNGTGSNLYDAAPASYTNETKAYYEDFISGSSNSNGMLVHGVKKGESPTLLVCWAQMGLPLAVVSIPFFNEYSVSQPKRLQNVDQEMSWLCKQSWELCKSIYPYDGDESQRYIDLSKLYNQEKTGILQRILNIEENVIKEGDYMIESFRRKGDIDSSAIGNFYTWVDRYLYEEYSKYFFELSLSGVLPLTTISKMKFDYWDIMGRTIYPDKKGLFIRSDGKKVYIY